MLSLSLRNNLLFTAQRMLYCRLSTTTEVPPPEQQTLLCYSVDKIDNDTLPPFVPKTPSGWQPPRPGGPIVKNLPFHVFRSRSNNLAVYSRFRMKGPRVNTVIRRIVGDKEALVGVLTNVLGEDRITEIDIREGKVNLKGNRVLEVMRVLYRMGF